MKKKKQQQQKKKTTKKQKTKKKNNKKTKYANRKTKTCFKQLIVCKHDVFEFIFLVTFKKNYF